MKHPEFGINLFTTCPPYAESDGETYRKNVSEISRWSDEAGCAGILVYTDNGLLDPWMISQTVIQSTTSLSPLVAVQPVYMHPFSVAKMVSTLSALFGRRICLNMVAGGFKNDLTALNDQTPHDKRYDRLAEYTTIIQRLLLNDGPLTFRGAFYSVENLRLKPALAPALVPIITVSGSSATGLAVARKLGAIPIRYPEPLDQFVVDFEDRSQGFGIRVGIIARESEEEAWQLAHERFPPDSAGQVTHALAMQTSDSVWHKTLSDLAATVEGTRSIYWLWPFKNYKTFCPYLVGSYTQVALEMAGYLEAGCNTVILDVPASEEDLKHIKTVFARAQALHGKLRSGHTQKSASA